MKKRGWKKWIPALLVLLLLGGGCLYAYLKEYPVEPDGSNLEECILEMYNRGRTADLSPEITLYDSLRLGDTVYHVLDLEENFGSVTLVKNPLGWYDWYKIDHLSYGSGNFRYGFVEHEGIHYALFGGRNTGNAMERAVFTLHDTEYQLEIPQSPGFLTSVPLEAPPEDVLTILDTLTLYNADGEDITHQYELSGGRF